MRRRTTLTSQNSAALDREDDDEEEDDDDDVQVRSDIRYDDGRPWHGTSNNFTTKMY